MQCNQSVQVGLHDLQNLPTSQTGCTKPSHL